MKTSHWSGKVKTVRLYRRACWLEFWRARPRGWTPCPVVLEVEYRCPRGSDGYIAYDEQNAIAALKSAIDSMADAGIVHTDSHKNMKWGAFRLITQAAAMKGKLPGVTVTVRRA